MNRIRTVSADLNRPECVRLGHDGHLYASDGRGGIMMIAANGDPLLIKAISTSDLSEPLIPNGIHPEKDGSFLIAHLGQFEGGVYRLNRSGELRSYMKTVDGIDLPPTNYVTRDHQARVWATVSTKLSPRSLDYRKSADTGFIVMDDGKGPRIVAEGLRYTNECTLSPDGKWLYINETFAKRTIRMLIGFDGSLGSSETVIEFGPGEFPDGMAFDAEGGLWIVCIFANSVIRVTPDGKRTTAIAQPDHSYVAEIEDAFREDRLTAAHMASAGTSPLKNISSIAFGGPGMRTAYLGSLQADVIFAFETPVPGLKVNEQRHALRAS